MKPYRLLGALLLIACTWAVSAQPIAAEDYTEGEPCETEYLGNTYTGELDSEGFCDLDCPDLDVTNIDLTQDGDPHGLDADNDGIGCDVEPVPTTQPTTTMPPTTPPSAPPAQPVVAQPAFTG